MLLNCTAQENIQIFLLCNDEVVSEDSDEDDLHHDVDVNEDCFIGNSDVPYKKVSFLNYPNTF